MTSRHQAPFAGANALIYGGAKGIGQAVALEFARRGARVAVADIDEAAAVETATMIAAEGGHAVGLSCNVLSDELVAATADAAEAALGPIDIVMNNVGGMLNGHPEDVPMQEWQRMMNINYFAAVRGALHFMPKFIERGSGYIVNTASFAGLYPYAASRVPYAAAKAAVISMSQNLALYLEPMGIRVSCLAPGPVLTGVMDSMTSWTADCPLRGPGSELELKLVADVANTLADGMAGGEVLIPTDPAVWDIIERWAASPDIFIRKKIDDFASGDSGRPTMSDAVKQKLAQDAAK
jgi:NAD(P)-dependent dehydrogenase (short-subunit alcohol dehydrogenase family)